MADFLDSDSDASTPSYLSPDNDEDYDDDYDEEDYDDLDEDDDDIKTRAVREGFSMHASEESKEKDKDWLSTQPASQVSATKTRRKTTLGVTGAIVGAIKGDIDALVIPKKKKFQKQSQQQHQQQQQQQQLQLVEEQTRTPTNSSNQHSLQRQTEKHHSSSKQPPMKKRKVSLSPTDSLAKQPSKTDPVIDLLADDDDDSDDEILAVKRDRMTKDELLPQRLSPSMLAAASKQQKEHVQASKKKKNKEATLEKKKQSIRSEVSKASCCESPPRKKTPASTEEQTEDPTIPQTKKTRAKSKNVPTKNSSKVKAPPKQNKTTKATNSGSSETKSTKTPIPTTKTTSATTSTTTTSTTKSNGKEKANTIESVPIAKPPSNTRVPSLASASASASASTSKAPPKKKKKRITFEEELLQKMFLSCRPYSIRDLVQLMGKTTSEASVNFCLLSLTDKNWIVKKEFKSGNRTKELYWANQESKDKNLWALESLRLPTHEVIRETRMMLASLQQQHKSLCREIEEVEKTPSNAQLSVLCQTAQHDVDSLTAKLESMKGRIASAAAHKKGIGQKKPGGGGSTRFHRLGGTKSLAPKKVSKTPLQLKKNINAMRDHWIKRKRKCMDFVDALADGMEKKVKDVVNKVLELETDEEANAVLPKKHAL